ncbi:hypothetical protein PG999_004056 [Apiospora kogelbergensis]|uniref:Polyketide synthase n=1 Tax=Apiospora kogelbergensis TaxID=1337665 RepID=A0AAW0R567_9PEZI
MGISGRGQVRLVQDPPERFNADQFYHPDSAKAGFISSQGGHFLPDDIYAFDAGFFNIKADEARHMDPQHRLLLECAFEAIEHAALRLSDLAGTDVGVFCANDYSDYASQMFEDLFTTNKYTALGNSPCLLANRVSYVFGLTGPSLAVDAACAGSHYALHLACQSIWSGECSAALVGGAKILNSPNMWSALDTMGALSPSGRSFAYDVKASGFGKGEGGGCIVLKPLRDALANGDPIRAVLRNAVCCHSGRTAGITMPSQTAQMALLKRLHTAVKLDPNNTTDPVDAGAIAVVLGSNNSSSNPLHIGSIKSNFGHLEGASGIISIIKSIMMLERGEMLPNAGFEKMNPNIEGGERLKVLTNPIPWRCNGLKRVCVMNSGFGGSSGAVLLEESPLPVQHRSAIATNGTPTEGQAMQIESGYENTANGPLDESILGVNPNSGSEKYAFVFSAKSFNSLKMYLSSFVEYTERAAYSPQLLKNICYTLGQRRTNFPQRVAVTADSLVSLKTQLLSMVTGDNLQAEKRRDAAVGYIFTGQGAQYFRMAMDLRCYDVFSNAIRDATETLRQLGAKWNLSQELEEPAHLSRVDNVEVSQPACTAIQIGLVLLLRSWGLSPTTVMGHSSGEIAAAFAAGFLSQETAMAIAYQRGVAANLLLRNKTVQGAMLALGASRDTAATLLADELGRVTVAAVNSPESVTVSGDLAAVDRVYAKAQKQGLFARKLKVGVAYHSFHMQQVADLYLESIKPFFFDGPPSPKFHSNTPLFISSVTGRVEAADTVGATYWVQNLVQPVNFCQATQTLFSLDKEHQAGNSQIVIRRPDVFIEIGPHPALKTPFLQTFENARTTHHEAGVKYLASLARKQNAEKTILDLAGTLFTMGVPINFAEVNRTTDTASLTVVDIPPYEWDKATRYTSQSRVTTEKLRGGSPYNPLIGWRSDWVAAGQDFRNIISLDDMPWIRGYALHGKPHLPPAVYLSMGIEAYKSLNPDAILSTVVVRDASFLQSLALEEDGALDITTRMRRLDDDQSTDAALPQPWAFEVASWSEVRGWAVHCRGVVESRADADLHASPRVQDALKVLQDGTLEVRSPANEYAILKKHGITYGGTSSITMVDLKQGQGRVVHTVKVPGSKQKQGSKNLATDPQTLDSFFHSLGMIQELTRQRLASSPTSLCSWQISDIPQEACQNLTVVTNRLAQDLKSGTMTVSLVVFQESGRSPKPVAALDFLELKLVPDPNSEHQTPLLPVTFWNKTVPSIDFMESSYLSGIISTQLAPIDERELRRIHELNSLSMYFISRMSAELADANLSGLPRHLSMFLAWTKRLVAQDFAMPRDPAEMITDFSKGNASDQLTCRVGGQMTDIILGKKQVLDLMLQDDLLSRYYIENTACARGNDAVAGYVQRLIDCNPDLRILEIGGGTASTALPVLTAIHDATEGATSYFHYTFTDISASFFENAREKLGAWSDRITFQKLDIGQPPESQGFQPNSYDLIIAANVLHVTSDMDVTMRHVRSLLKPSGKLALLEIVKDLMPFGFPFAMLPGWWAAEDEYRSIDGPLMSEQTWTTLLTTNGFSGIEGRVDDYPNGKDSLYSAMWSSAVAQPATAKTHPSFAVCATGSGSCSAFAERLSTELASRFGARSRTQTLAELAAGDKPLCVIVDDPQDSILSNLSETAFRALKEIWTNAAGLLWILPEESHPDAEMIRGFLKAIRQEDSSKSYLLLDKVPMGPRGVATAIRIAQRLLSTDPAVRLEQEFSLVNEVIHVPRLFRAYSAREAFALEAAGEDSSPMYRAPGTLLRPDATYIITGGTGGIGRSIAGWMATQGAKYIVMLGRSGPSRPDVAALLRTFEGTDICMRAITCDVGSHTDMVRAAESLGGLPKVRGVIHGAMCLRDAMLVNSTYDDWINITSPKIQGAWNVHHIFQDLDFFVALSSLDGVMGNVGQSIYSGTSTFLDAFVDHRLGLGLPAVCITLPVITEIGFVAANKLSERISNSVAYTFDVPQVHTMVKAAIIGPASGVFSKGWSFSFFQDRVSPETEPLDWECFLPCAAVRRPVETSGGGRQTSDPSARGSQEADGDLSESAMERVGDKISSVTMIDRHEVTPERDLTEYGLDSLVAVDLRNWIRRTFGVDLALKKIVQSSNLRSLTEDILSEVNA